MIAALPHFSTVYPSKLEGRSWIADRLGHMIAPSDAIGFLTAIPKGAKLIQKDYANAGNQRSIEPWKNCTDTKR